MKPSDKTLTPPGPAADRAPQAEFEHRVPVEGGPEVPPGMEEVQTWDEAAGAGGVRIEPILPDDDLATAGLVQEGVDEADRELRLEADTEFEDESSDTDTAPPTTGILS